MREEGERGRRGREGGREGGRERGREGKREGEVINIVCMCVCLTAQYKYCTCIHMYIGDESLCSVFQLGYLPSMGFF